MANWIRSAVKNLLPTLLVAAMVLPTLFLLAAVFNVEIVDSVETEDTSPVVVRIKDGDEFIEFTLDEVRTFRTWWSAWNE